MIIRYFAWVREKVGVDEEQLALPDSIQTVGDLTTYLATIDDNHAAAFADADTIRAAINQEHVDADTPIAGATEIAFFPPMTGG